MIHFCENKIDYRIVQIGTEKSKLIKLLDN